MVKLLRDSRERSVREDQFSVAGESKLRNSQELRSGKDHNNLKKVNHIKNKNLETNRGKYIFTL